MKRLRLKMELHYQIGRVNFANFPGSLPPARAAPQKGTSFDRPVPSLKPLCFNWDYTIELAGVVVQNSLRVRRRQNGRLPKKGTSFDRPVPSLKPLHFDLRLDHRIAKDVFVGSGFAAGGARGSPKWLPPLVGPSPQRNGSV